METQTDEYAVSDKLYEKAVEYVRTKRMASVQTFQRALSVRYTVAARIVDRMESEKKIGPYTGTAPRKILI